VTWEKLVDETVAFGSPETVTRHIAHMRELGIGHILRRRPHGAQSADLLLAR
jgi:hypothetical protein